MRGAGRIGARALVLLFVLAAAGLIGLRAGVWNTRYSAVFARYGAPPSQVIQAGRTDVLFRDEGHGPVLVLVHSSMMNLREWDRWAEALSAKYRVIRLDWPPYGLSVDPGPYGMEAARKLLEEFVDRLNLGRFTLIGSSSGATLCVLYAARHPERVAALALSSLPLAAPPPSHTDVRLTLLGWAHRQLFPNYFPRTYYRVLLESTFADPRKVTPDMVEWMFAINNLEGAQARIGEYLQADLKGIWKVTGHGDAAQVSAPVLLQWGDADPVLPAYLAEDARSRFRNAQVTVIHYPDSGHYPMLEIPERTEADLEEFLVRIHAATR